MKKYAVDGTHEAHGVFVLRDARVTPRRVALLEFANGYCKRRQWGQLRARIRST